MRAAHNSIAQQRPPVHPQWAAIRTPTALPSYKGGWCNGLPIFNHQQGEIPKLGARQCSHVTLPEIVSVALVQRSRCHVLRIQLNACSTAGSTPEQDVLAPRAPTPPAVLPTRHHNPNSSHLVVMPITVRPAAEQLRVHKLATPRPDPNAQPCGRSHVYVEDIIGLTNILARGITFLSPPPPPATPFLHTHFIPFLFVPSHPALCSPPVLQPAARFF